MQRKTQRLVQFEITAGTREAWLKRIKFAGLKSENFPFPRRIRLCALGHALATESPDISRSTPTPAS